MPKLLISSLSPKIIKSNQTINSANYGLATFWDNSLGNPTTVGTNGGTSYYGTYDQSGSIFEIVYINIATSMSFIGGDSRLYIEFFQDAGKFTLNNDANTKFPYVGLRICSLNNEHSFNNFVTIGDINNIQDNYQLGNQLLAQNGSVNYEYKINKFLVTVNDYVAFLNSVSSIDTYDLYYSDMPITRLGSSGSYTYTAKLNYENKPISYIDWFSAARYCNWLHNNKPSGYQNVNTTEDGAYTLNGLISGNIVNKNLNARYHIPTLDEWYKAAYYTPNKNNSGPGYWIFATQSDSMPLMVSSDASGNGRIPPQAVSPKIRN